MRLGAIAVTVVGLSLSGAIAALAADGLTVVLTVPAAREFFGGLK